MKITGGLSSVSVDGVTITGNGTPGNPLVGAASSVTGWPIQFWSLCMPGGGAVLAFATTINTLDLWGITIPCQVKFNSIIFNVNVADAVNNYDVGLYTYAGALVAHTGAIHIPTTGIVKLAVVGGPITLAPGRYYLATTGNSNTGKYIYITFSQGNLLFFNGQAFGSSAGGVLPNTIVPPTDVISDNIGVEFGLTI